MSTLRSLLFVPAARPDRFERALEAGADAVCLDLEDAVSADGKTTARVATQAFIERYRSGAMTPRGPAVGLRINALDSAWWEADLMVAAGAAFVMVPKAASPQQIDEVRARAPGAAIWPLVETPEGLHRVWEIAAADGVHGVLFGAFDYAAEVGCEMDWEALLFARSLIAVACAGAGVQAMDAPSGDVRAIEALNSSSIAVRRLGFTARACIHPEQVAVVNAAFAPSPGEIEKARRILEAFDAANGAAALLDGRLIEAPVAKAARQLLARVRD